MFSETPPVAVPFRENVPITLGDVQGLHLTGAKRKECEYLRGITHKSDYENIKNYALRCSAGTIKERNDYKLENAKLQVGLESVFHSKELCYLSHVSSSYEELFIRRNAILLFMHRLGSMVSSNPGFFAARR